jgi:hypothetical protein
MTEARARKSQRIVAHKLRGAVGQNDADVRITLAVGQRVFLVCRLGVADFGVAQLIHSGDVARALRCRIWLSAAVRFATESNSHEPNPMYPAVPMYPRCTQSGLMDADGCEPRRGNIEYIR